MNKDVKDLVKKLHRNGLKTRFSGAGHVAILDPLQNDRRVYSIPSTPSSSNWRANAEADLNRMGLLTRRKNKRDAGGQTPPPLPDINWKEVPLSTVGDYEVLKQESGPRRKFVIVTSRMIDEGVQLFDEISTEYDLASRGDRKTGHGSGPILAQAMIAYEAETGEFIPHFEYAKSGKDTRDTSEMARLAAARAASFAAEFKAGMNASPVTVASLEYGLKAWDWLKSLDFNFPDGRKIYMYGQGLKIDMPLLKPQMDVESEPEVEVDPWASLKAELEGTQAPEPAIPDALQDALDSLEAEGLIEQVEVDEGQLLVYTEKRAMLAVRVAAAISDPRAAEALAFEVLRS
jgi:hypothetical protein